MKTQNYRILHGNNWTVLMQLVCWSQRTKSVLDGILCTKQLSTYNTAKRTQKKNDRPKKTIYFFGKCFQNTFTFSFTSVLKGKSVDAKAQFQSLLQVVQFLLMPFALKPLLLDRFWWNFRKHEKCKKKFSNQSSHSTVNNNTKPAPQKALKVMKCMASFSWNFKFLSK